MDEPDDLQRFVDAQDRDGTYDRALRELRAGRKTSHWIWFVFPQVAGLGRSELSRRYALSGVGEASAYLRHPVLGPRLRTSLAALEGDPVSVLGGLDAQKLHSCLTLFALAAPDEPLFPALLARWFRGELDAGTTARL